MEPLDLLRLEAETIWGLDGGALGSGTVAVTALTYDGQCLLIQGKAEPDEERALQSSVARCWLLKDGAPLKTPVGLRLVHHPEKFTPPARWSPEEWRQLMDGTLGPWTALVDDHQVVSLAHSARITTQAAEVGVQTEESWQGRGLAPIVVNAWAGLMRESGRTLFYSAFEANVASHRVAVKCAVTPLGLLSRIWQS